MTNCKLLLFTLTAVSVLGQQPVRDAMFNRTLAAGGLVKGGWVEAHWMEDGDSFWFAAGGRGDTVLYKYDPIKKAKTTLVDAGRLRNALTPVLGHEIPGTGLPIDKLTFLSGEKSARISFQGREFILQMDSYALRTESDTESDRHKPRLLNKAVIAGPPPVYETLSPDGRWFLGAKDGNLYLRSTIDGHTEALTTDGTQENGWDYQWNSVPLWAPDSGAVAVAKNKPPDRPGSLYPIVHWLKPNPDVEWVPRENSGRNRDYYIIDIASHRQVPTEGNKAFLRGWRPDGSELLITRSASTQIELIAANRKTGAARTLFRETTNTFFDVSIGMPNSPTFTALAGGREFLWLSERDGWNQIYLYGFDGTLIRKLTEDLRPVERVVAVDEKNGWVYYTAHGGEDRPYDFHLYRVKVNGGKASRLTDAPGKHDQAIYVSYQGARGEGIQFSPSRQFFLDSHSDVNRPPQTDLRRADGTLVEVLSKASADALLAVRPNPPEEFTAKAADGTTDLYGVLYKPYDFDPNKKYPVVDFLYAGPQMTRVPRSFLGAAREQAFANLGLLLLVVDARGTPERGKAFQDVVYKNIGRNEIPDHVAVLKQLAAARSYLDMSRVAAFGGSFGGYFAIRALLQAPGVFHVGIAMAPLSDLRQANHEGWMGRPEENKEAYDYASNLLMAGNLQGHLLLLHGTSDVNAPFSATMQMIDALERANKPYDLVVFPEKDHNVQNSPYSLQAVKRYLVEHLKP